jgi:nucleotide-binding universal stress UspA family protein
MTPAEPKARYHEPVPLFERVLIAVDGSKTSTRAVQVGHELARQVGAAIALVHVLDLAKGFTPELGIADTRVIDELREVGVDVLDRCFHEISPAGEVGVIPVTRLMREGDPASEIVRAADEWRADVIVIGTHARGPIARFLLGSTAEAVVRRAHCPVLTVGHTRTAAGQEQQDTPAAAAASR